jgi:hypothetical protein
MLLVLVQKKLPFGKQLSEVAFVYLLHYRKVYSLLWSH